MLSFLALGPRLFALVALCVLTLGGCAARYERETVHGHFSAQLACPEARVTRELGGYHVRGCGVTAHYVCIDENEVERAELDERSEARDEHARQHGASAGDAAGALFDMVLALNMYDTCRLDRPRFERVEMRDVATRHHGQQREVHANVLASTGHLALSAVPSVQPEISWLTFHTHAPVPDDACSVSWFVDGESIPPGKAQKTAERVVRFPLPTGGLIGAARAVRVSARVCGVEIEFDEDARRTLASFAARAREESAQPNVLAEAR